MERSTLSIIILFIASILSLAHTIITLIKHNTIIFSNVILALFVVAWSWKRLSKKI